MFTVPIDQFQSAVSLCVHTGAEKQSAANEATTQVTKSVFVGVAGPAVMELAVACKAVCKSMSKGSGVKLQPQLNSSCPR